MQGHATLDDDSRWLVAAGRDAHQIVIADDRWARAGVGSDDVSTVTVGSARADDDRRRRDAGVAGHIGGGGGDRVAAGLLIGVREAGGPVTLSRSRGAIAEVDDQGLDLAAVPPAPAVT